MTGSLLLLAAGLCAQAPVTAPFLELEVHAEPEAGRLAGVASLELPAGMAQLLLHPAFTISAARLAGKALELQRPGGATSGLHLWRVQLPTAGRLELDYSGLLAPLDSGIDHRAVLGAVTPMANADWAWLPAASYWYPVPAEGISGYRLEVSSSRGSAIAAGVAERPDAHSSRFEFRHPVAGVDLLIGPYREEERALTLASGQTVQVRSFFTEALAGESPAYLAAAASQVEAYSQQLGAYPYDSFSIVASPLPTGFGMPGLTWLGEEVIRLPFIKSTSLRHEVLHNWWGNGVRVAYTQGNWSEGLTTLMADYATRAEAGPDAAAAMRLGWVRSLLAVPAAERTSLEEFRFREHGRLAAVGYGKSAFLLWMLQQDIGAESFDAGLRSFYSQCLDRSASWSDLITAMERASGKSLAASLRPWLTRRDLPDPVILSATRRNPDQPLELRLELRQSAPAYALRLPVLVHTSAGEEWHLLDFTETTATLVVQTSAPAESVVLDPQLERLRAPQADELPPILRNLILSQAPGYRVTEATPEWAAAARVMAEAFFERPAVPLAAPDPALPDELLLGTPATVLAELQRQGLPATLPTVFATTAEVMVWTLSRPGGGTIGMVCATTPEALAALAGRLPHYGGESYLGFSGGRPTVRGAWPLASRKVMVTTSAAPPGSTPEP